MEKIDKFINPENLTSQPQPENLAIRSEQEDRLLTRVFAVLMGQYGSSFTAMISNDDAEAVMRNEWAKGLRGIPMENIGKALDALPDLHPKWPPTIGEFKAICNIGKTDLQEFKALPRPYSDPKLAEEALSECLRILGRGGAKA